MNTTTLKIKIATVINEANLPIDAVDGVLFSLLHEIAEIRRGEMSAEINKLTEELEALKKASNLFNMEADNGDNHSGE